MRIYVEGGGSTGDQKAKLRKGFEAFFARSNVTPQVVACGSRDSTHKMYRNAVKAYPGEKLLLLVDSEDSVRGSRSRWQFLHERDRWQLLKKRKEDDCHLMVRTMETWIVADSDALSTYYGANSLAGALSRRDDLEDVPKEEVARSLEVATRRTQKGRYRKIDHGAELLARIDPTKVRHRAPHCARLLDTLQALAANQG